jgi:type I restriction enzyme S subunit
MINRRFDDRASCPAPKSLKQALASKPRIHSPASGNGGHESGWERAPLTAITRNHDSRRIPLNKDARDQRRGAYPYYGANGLVDSVDDYIFDGEFALLAEDGGYFDDPQRGVAYKAAGKFWVNNHAHIFEPLGGVSVDFLVLLLNATDWMPHVSGTTRLKLTQGGIQRAGVPVPPLAEQHRIVAKLDSLFARIRAARNELARISLLLEHYKQAILSKAFTGELTEDWRSTNGIPSAKEVDLAFVASDFTYGSAAKSMPVWRRSGPADGEYSKWEARLERPGLYVGPGRN